MKKQIFAMAAIAAVLLASCAKDDNSGVTGDNQTKNITLSFSDPVGSRTIDGSASDGSTKTTFSTGQIIFVNNAQVSDVYTIIAGATDMVAKQIGIGDLYGAGKFVTFAGIKATNVYVVGNYAIPGMAVGKNLSADVLAAELTTAQLKDGSFATAVLYGTAPVTPDSNNPNAVGGPSDHYADVTIKPVAARFEIEKLTDISATQDYTFELAGIYINNYYPTMEIAATTGKGTKVANIAGEFTATQYPGTTSTFHDVLNLTTPAKTFSPVAANTVWAYQMFPAANVAAGDDNLPHVIVHMKNLKKDTELIYADYYLTIRTYGATKTIQSGYIYTIADIRFDASKDGDVIPESQLIDCDLAVSVASWIPATLTPDIN